jgi:hypothetical protein
VKYISTKKNKMDMTGLLNNSVQRHEERSQERELLRKLIEDCRKDILYQFFYVQQCRKYARISGNFRALFHGLTKCCWTVTIMNQMCHLY